MIPALWNGNSGSLDPTCKVNDMTKYGYEAARIAMICIVLPLPTQNLNQTKSPEWPI